MEDRINAGNWLLTLNKKLKFVCLVNGKAVTHAKLMARSTLATSVDSAVRKPTSSVSELITSVQSAMTFWRKRRIGHQLNPALVGKFTTLMAMSGHLAVVCVWETNE